MPLSGLASTIVGLGCIILSFLGPAVGLFDIRKAGVMTPEEAFAPKWFELKATPEECIPIPPGYYRCGRSVETCISFGKYCPDANLVKCETKAEKTSCFCKGEGKELKNYLILATVLEICDKAWYTTWYETTGKSLYKKN